MAGASRDPDPSSGFVYGGEYHVDGFSKKRAEPYSCVMDAMDCGVVWTRSQRGAIKPET